MPIAVSNGCRARRRTGSLVAATITPTFQPVDTSTSRRQLRTASSSGRRSASGSASESLWRSSSILALRATRHAPARSLIRVTHLGPTRLRPPRRGGRSASGDTSRDGAAPTPVPQEPVAPGAERARPSARAARAHRPAHASPHRSRPDDGEALVDAGLDRRRIGDERWLVAPYGDRNWVQERARRGLGRAPARTPSRAARRRGARARGRRSRPARVLPRRRA